MLKRLLAHPLVILLALVVTSLLVISMQIKKDQLNKRAETIADQAQVVEKLEAEVKTLEEKIEFAQQPFAQEKVIRNELLMQREGELVIQLPLDQLPTPTPTPTPPTQTPWEAWRALLFSSASSLTKQN